MLYYQHVILCLHVQHNNIYTASYRRINLNDNDHKVSQRQNVLVYIYLPDEDH